MKTAIVSKLPPEEDGIAIYTYNIISKFKKLNYITIGDTGSKADYNISFKSWKFPFELLEICKKEKVSVIHIQHISSWYSKLINYNLLIFLLLSRVKKIVTMHEIQMKARTLKRLIIKLTESLVIAFSSKVLVHSIIQKKIIKNKKVKLMLHGSHNRNISYKYRLNQTLLQFGIINENKGIIELVKAMDYLPDKKLIIAGNFASHLSKKFKNNLKSLIKSAKYKNIEFIQGWISEVDKIKLYKKADLVCTTYSFAPYQSGIVHDAVSNNRPVIANRVGSYYEMVEKFNFGYVLNNLTPKTIAKGIEKAYENYYTYKKGLNQYRKLTDWNEVAKNHKKIYENEKKN